MNEYNYDDIIDLPHHVSKRHSPMPRLNRAAQFAPFAALTGYAASVKEEARLTDEREELSEEQIEILNAKTAFLRERISSHPTVTVTYFLADERKEGGRYAAFTGELYAVDLADENLIFKNKMKINMADILDIESDILSGEIL